MGSRGASSGRARNGKKYGTEYRTVYQSGNIKFVEYKGANSAKAPMETMTKGRIYATVTKQGELKYISYYDKHGKRYKQIDIDGHTHSVGGNKIAPHTHKGYEHDERGTRDVTSREAKIVERVRKTWYNYLSKQ